MEQTTSGGPVTLQCLASIEYDGFLRTELHLVERQPPRDIQSLVLEVPVKKEHARYLYTWPTSFGSGGSPGQLVRTDGVQLPSDRVDWRRSPRAFLDVRVRESVGAGRHGQGDSSRPRRRAGDAPDSHHRQADPPASRPAAQVHLCLPGHATQADGERRLGAAFRQLPMVRR